MRLLLLLPLSFALLIDPAHAYVGPGLGAGAIGAVLGVVAAIFLAVFAVVYYPIKRAIKKKKAAQAANTPDALKSADTEQ